MSFYIQIFLIVLSFSQSSSGNIDSLRSKIEHAINNKDAVVGVSIRGIEDNNSLSINGDAHFPMQSVFKFHIALAVLNQVDKGKFKLDQEIFISKDDLLPNTWSPIRDKYPDGNIKLTLAEILKYTVAMSDNNGCDILLKMIGGPKAVEKYINKLGIKDIAISFNEEEMHKHWNAQFSNWTTPKASTDLLIKFFIRKILSDSSYSFLLKTMAETTTGKNRIRGQLPEGTTVAHKTGSSGTNDAGITAAVNDIGIVTLPDGKHFAISVFVTNSKENDETNEKIISDISKLTWDYFIERSNFPESNTIRTGDNSMTSLDWVGKYEGIIPCADCEGIQTLMKLNNNLTYTMQTRYLGKDDKIFENSGTFNWDKEGRKITLINFDSALGARYYWVGENHVIQLDLEGNRIAGNLADKYILKKVDNQITEKYWKLVELSGKKVQHSEKNKREPHIILKAENNLVHGGGGCNTFNGKYELAERNRITFSKITSTLMACENMEIEVEFFNVLQTADNYVINGDTLFLHRAKMAPLAKFEAVYFK